MKTRQIHPSGFTLIEVIIVIAILAVVAGAMAPLAVQSINGSRRDLTNKRQEFIYRAIFGDPSAPGSGFISDIGRLPALNLAELTTPGSLPIYSLQPCGSRSPYLSEGISTAGLPIDVLQPCGIGMGWRGPYLLEGANAAGLPVDGWGTPMVLQEGQIRSAGPDQNMNTVADNLVYPSTPIASNNINGSIVLTVTALDTSTSQPVFVPAAGQATVYYSQNGLLQSYVLTSASGSYIFTPQGRSLPQGIHAITVTGDPDGPGPQPSKTNSMNICVIGGGTMYQTIALR
jgi:prepilin-type N-terminal cleavage/methylation domain-containing protein